MNGSVRFAGLIVFFLLTAAAAPGLALAGGTTATGMQMLFGNGGEVHTCTGTCPIPETARLPRDDPRPSPSPESAACPCPGPAPEVFFAARDRRGASGIRRIYRKNVLDHPERRRIYVTIIEKPGIDRAGLAGRLGANSQTLRYHLGLLLALGKIVALKDRKVTRYYENHGRYGSLEQEILGYLWNPTALRLLVALRDRPGMTQSDIAGLLGITASSVRWYMHRLRCGGITGETRDGRCTRYALTPAAYRILESMEQSLPEHAGQDCST